MREELFQYHPELVVLLGANAVCIVLALVLKRRALHLFALFCVVGSSIFFIRAHRFEQEWNAGMNRMYAVFQEGYRDRSLETAQELLRIARDNYPAGSTRSVEAFHHVGWLLIHTGRAAEAEPFLRQSLAGYEKLDQALPNNSTLVCSHGVGNEKSLLGYVYQQTGRLELAERFYTEALEHYRTRCPAFPEYEAEMTGALSGLGNVQGR